MKIVSVNVGLPREVVWKGITVQTAIFKEPVTGAVSILKLNLAGDQQADLTVHGGMEKAVYAYPVEHSSTGGSSCLRSCCHGVHLVRTLRPKA